MASEKSEDINIVVLCDGTFNNPHIKTNVFKLYKLLISDESKRKNEICGPNKKLKIPRGARICDDYYYEAGVGTNFNLIDGAIADHLDNKIKRAYRHIVQRYNYHLKKDENNEPKIWLFGFSRGAYVVRCVTGLIRNCGILKYDNNQCIDRAYEIYRNRNQNYIPNGQESEKFRNLFSHSNPTIKFLGLWDTVGAHGLPTFTVGKGFEYLKLHDQSVSKIVKNAYQILSIHENVSFLEPCRIFRKNEDKNPELVTEEIWFPGAHLEIGGGIYSKNQNISWESYLWMIEKIKNVGGLLLNEPNKEKQNSFERLKIRLLSSSVYNLFRFVGFWSITHRDRIIPLYKDDNILTFDMLYKEGNWKFKKFNNISDAIKKKEKNSLTYFYNAIEGILVEELCKVHNGSGNRVIKDGKINKDEINELFEKINNNNKDIKFDPRILNLNSNWMIERITKSINETAD